VCLFLRLRFSKLTAKKNMQSTAEVAFVCPWSIGVEKGGVNLAKGRTGSNTLVLGPGAFTIAKSMRLGRGN